MSISPTGRTSDRFVFFKSAASTLGLLALSYGALRAAEHFKLCSLTALQKKQGGAVATLVYGFAMTWHFSRPKKEPAVDPQTNFNLREQLAVYNPHAHGMNGSTMRETYFKELLTAIMTNLIKEGTQKDPQNSGDEERACLEQIKSALNPANGGEASYGILVTYHQKLMGLKNLSAEGRAFSRSLAKARMTVRMQGSQEAFVSHFTSKYQPELSLGNFAEVFRNRNRLVEEAPAEMKMWSVWSIWNKLWGALSRVIFFKVNPPSLLETITLSGDRKIDYIRMPTPHLSGAAIDPTFTEYLRILQDENKGFLYCSHQRLLDQNNPHFDIKKVFEKEDPRSQSLIALEEKHPNFLLIFQSVENEICKEEAIEVND